MSSSLSDLPGVGPATLQDLHRLGLTAPDDLLRHYPSRHEDLSQKQSVADVQPGEVVTIEGVVARIGSRVTPHRRMVLVEASVSDETGTIPVLWFNQRYLLKVLTIGTNVRLAGQVERGPRGLGLKNPTFEIVRREGQASVHTGRLVPIYPLTGSLTQKRLRALIAGLLKRPLPMDWLPVALREREGLIDLGIALRDIHFPEDADALEVARVRLQFDELFLYELVHLKSRGELKKLRASAIPTQIDTLKAFVDRLPFTLTSAQRKAAWEIVKDMEAEEPMNRLLEGDVGSGKTVVAALAAVSAAASGFQTALLAPTEILAEQHFKNFQRLFAQDADRVALVTRTKGKERIDELAKGKIDVVVGTHAILEEGVQFHRLGLVIVDEQHRFGVKQRQALQGKHGEGRGVPHLLSMTATPIPRTLALTLYGDLDISVLNEMPKGRKPVKTTIVRRGKEEAVFERIRGELAAGRQAFVVCPLIDPSDAFGAKSVTELAEELAKGPLKGYRCAVLHGRMKSQEKEEIMAGFVSGEIPVLVSTTVVEVGVDVPNATVMLIEGAECFGLAQMHQLRGRVGRSDKPSYCYLRPSGFVPEKTYERLRALVDCANGFELAERDLAQRGPGDVYGVDQSGFPEFKLANLFDAPMISRARNAAKRFLEEDPDIARHPAVLHQLEVFGERIHFE